MTTLHQTEVDGVQCFWVETGRPTLAAQLVFRYGLVDEPLREAGFVHLLEHLALHDRGSGSLHVNGQVSLTETVFDTHGPAEQVAAHLAEVTAWLAAPEYGELARERRVLGAESAVRGTGPTARALSWRYGARGPGVVAYPEAGLGRATAPLLDARAAVAFARGNAVLVLDGPPPAGLRLALPDGGLHPLAPAVPVETKPGMYVEESGLVMSGAVPRSVAAGFAAQLLQKALVDRLRHQEGAAYAPWSTYERVDADHAVLMAGSDVQAAALPTLAETVLELRTSLLRPVDRAALTELLDAQVQAMRDPYAQIGVAVRASRDALAGREPMSHEELVAEVEAVTAAEVYDTYAPFIGSLLVGLPGATTWADQLRRVTPRVTDAVPGGTRHRSVNWPADQRRLVLTADSVAIQEDGSALAVRYTEAEGVLAHENGLRQVVPPDGFAVIVNPHEWRGGTAAVARLDGAVPPDRLLPLPAVDGIAEGVQVSTWRRWTWPLRDQRSGLVRTLYVLAGFALVIAGFVVTALLDNGAPALVCGVLGLTLARSGLRGPSGDG